MIDEHMLKKDDETVDAFFDGRLRILQKKSGYRFSIDSLLLAYFVKLKRDNHVVDLGSGSGIISLILAYRYESVAIEGVEIQEGLADMARRSVRLNGFQDRIKIHHGDINGIKGLFQPRSIDVVAFNPPYRRLDSGKINPNHERAVARHEIRGTLSNFLASAGYLLREAGVAYIIYPATRGAGLLYHMRRNGIEPKRLRMIHSRSSSRAEFILIEGVKGGGEELEVMAPLFIYNKDGGYTGEMEAIFKEISRPQ